MGEMRQIGKGLRPTFRNGDLSVDVAELLNERARRIRIRDSIFDDEPQVKGSECERIAEHEALGIALISPSIVFRRVGLEILCSSIAGKEFNEETLHLNFQNSKSEKFSNHSIYLVSREDLNLALLLHYFENKLHKQAILNSLLEYAFFIMSCHSSERLVEACYDTLKYHLNSCELGKHKTSVLWAPSVQNITSVFWNYGAPKDMFTSDHVPLPSTVASNETTEGIRHAVALKNIAWVIKYIDSLLFYDERRYSAEELEQLFCMVSVIGLDKNILCHELLEAEFAKCTKRILNSYSLIVQKETGMVSKFSKILHPYLRNVCGSDLYFMSRYYMSYTGFGEKLAISLLYCFILDAVKPAKSMPYLDEVKVEDMRRILRQDCLMDVDYLNQYVILMYINEVINHLKFTSEKRKELRKLMQSLSNLRVKANYTENSVDYYTVKQLVTTAYAGWKLVAGDEVGLFF